MNKFNLSEFSEISAAAWKQKIQVDLKGADYNQTLLWHTNDEITVKPFYHQDHNIPTANINSSNWKIAQYILVNDCTIANTKAVEAIKSGAESLVFKIENENIDYQKLIKNIPLQKIEIQFLLHSLNEVTIQNIISLNIPNAYFNIDPIGHLAKTGNWHFNIQQDFQIIKKLLHANPTKNLLSIDTSIYQNAGANIVQQLAYAIAHANEYLDYFKTNKIPNLQFITATGGNYFFEIAKLRALKLLYKTIRSEYDNKTKCDILSFPSTRNKTIYDYNVNMLRTTTECMSATLGGASTVCNLPYDFIYHNSNEFGDRIARNQLLILKNESAFNKVSNPADGAYYIESITQQLAEKALTIFKQIEKSGGFLKQLKSGTIQRKIKESALVEQQQFNNESIVLLGTNKHQNAQDKMKNELQKKPFLKKKSRKTLIAPIISKRLSEKIDLNRLKQE